MRNDGEDGLEGRNCVPYFETDKSQIIFEFFYLLVTLFAVCGFVFFVEVNKDCIGISYSDKAALFSLSGGFLGGWVYDAKWFYRVTARGKSNQYQFLWQSHKFYWRVLTPFLSSLVAFSVYLLAQSEFIPFEIKNSNSAKTAFSVSFFLGYFSDLVLSRLAGWAESIIPRKGS